MNQNSYQAITAMLVVKKGEGGLRRVRRFVEKPTPEKADEFFRSGSYLWNAGIFAVRASVWLDAIGEFRPDIFKACERAYRQGKRDGVFYRVGPDPQYPKDPRYASDIVFDGEGHVSMFRIKDGHVERNATRADTDTAAEPCASSQAAETAE